MLAPLAMIGIEPLIIILVIVLVLFGGQKIPELLRGVGRGVGELQKGLDEGKRTLQNSIREDPNHNPQTTITSSGQPVVTSDTSQKNPSAQGS